MKKRLEKEIEEIPNRAQTSYKQIHYHNIFEIVFEIIKFHTYHKQKTF